MTTSDGEDPGGAGTFRVDDGPAMARAVRPVPHGLVRHGPMGKGRYAVSIRLYSPKDRLGAQTRASPTIGDVTVKAVISDWGGVLTSPLNEAVGVWLAADGIDAARYLSVMREWVRQAYDGGGHNPIHGLEDGSLDPAEFERLLAAELVTVDGGPVLAEGLISRMFSAFAPVEVMYEALRGVRAAGGRTALLSNSWGNEYPRELFAELFDAVVISCEVGMRKPDERIFRHAVDLLGLAPAECVFIDDIDHNVRAAEAVGMRTIHHREAAETIEALRDLGVLR